MVEGPLGRAVLADLAGASAQFRGQPVTEPALREALSAGPSVLRATDWLADADALTRRVGTVVQDYAYGPASRWIELQPALLACRDTLGEVAGLVTGSPAAQWWWSPPPYGQRWVGEPGREPAQGDRLRQGLEAETAQLTRPAPDHRSARRLRTEGPWWSSITGAEVPGTTRATGVPDAPAVALLCRDGHGYFGAGHVQVWSIEVSQSARVYEVTGPADWLALVGRYPLEVTSTRGVTWNRWAGTTARWLLPDWRGVAADWDGVHVSLGGHLATAYQALSLESGHTMLAGWNPDETVWLNDVLTAIKPGPIVSSPDIN